MIGGGSGRGCGSTNAFNAKIFLMQVLGGDCREFGFGVLRCLGIKKEKQLAKAAF